MSQWWPLSIWYLLYLHYRNILIYVYVHCCNQELQNKPVFYVTDNTTKGSYSLILNLLHSMCPITKKKPHTHTKQRQSLSLALLYVHQGTLCVCAMSWSFVSIHSYKVSRSHPLIASCSTCEGIGLQTKITVKRTVATNCGIHWLHRGKWWNYHTDN